MSANNTPGDSEVSKPKSKFVEAARYIRVVEGEPPRGFRRRECSLDLYQEGAIRSVVEVMRTPEDMLVVYVNGIRVSEMPGFLPWPAKDV